MAKKLGTIKILLWIGIIIFFALFIYLTFFPQMDRQSAVEDFLFRMLAIFPLSWAVLFFFAQKDVVKNIAIINCAIISWVLSLLAFILYSSKMGGRITLEGWIEGAILFVYMVLLFIFKPKATQ